MGRIIFLKLIHECFLIHVEVFDVCPYAKIKILNPIIITIKVDTLPATAFMVYFMPYSIITFSLRYHAHGKYVRDTAHILFLLSMPSLA